LQGLPLLPFIDDKVVPGLLKIWIPWFEWISNRERKEFGFLFELSSYFSASFCITNLRLGMNTNMHEKLKYSAVLVYVIRAFILG
jgi:hypothetical protein